MELSDMETKVTEGVTMGRLDSWLSTLDCVILIVGVTFSVFYYLYSQSEHVQPKLMPSFKPVISSSINCGFERESFAAKIRASGKNMVVFYGSQTGTAEDFAFRLAKSAVRYGLKAIALDPEEFDMEELHLLAEIPNSLVVFCLATYGEGDPTDNARELHEFMQRAEANLSGLNYAVFGLGNKTYEHFNAMAQFVDKRLTKLGASRIAELGLGDDDGNLEEDFMLWKDEFWAAVCKHFNITTVSEEMSVREYELTVFDSGQAVETFSGEVARINSYSAQRAPFHQKNPFLAPVKVNRDLHCAGERICKHIEFSLVGSRLRYEAGDHLAVYPRNDPFLVDQFSELLDVDLDTVMTLTCTDPDSSKRTPFPCPCSYRTALSFYVDFTSPPRMNVIKELVQHCSNPEEKQLLLSMVTMTEESRKKYLSWIVADQRSVLDIMVDLPSCRPPLDLLLELLPRLQPRYYSISSSPKVDPDIVSITAVVVKYVTPLGRIRKGVATNYLASFQPADEHSVSKVPIFIRRSQFRLPSSPKVPVLMIGPGTGIAPFHGFIQQRAVLKKQGVAFGQMVLYYGCRRRTEDYLYGEELEKWLEEGVLTELHVAFSREQEKKIYVQHLMLENKKSVWEMLQLGSYVYVCGDARNMARDVQATLVRIISEESNVSTDEATAYVKQMEVQKRYQIDVWSMQNISIYQ